MPRHETLEGDNRETSKVVPLCSTRDFLLEILYRSLDATIVRLIAERLLGAPAGVWPGEHEACQAFFAPICFGDAL